ncbi:DUF1764 domain protein, partial [Rhizoctonia solani AG-3 Rhs1AP]
MGEIDDIFSGKSASKGKSKEPEPKQTPGPQTTLRKKKKKGKKVVEPDAPAKDSVDQPEPVEPVSAGTKRKAPETIVDPSLEVEVKSKKTKSSKAKVGKKSAAVDSDDERFRDSRGTGPRRRTEEGYAIYKEDELGINDEGGG